MPERKGSAPLAIVLALFIAVCAESAFGRDLKMMPCSSPHGSGAFIESRSKAAHTWRINEQHSLLWEGQPYLPVGGAFTPHSLDDSSDAAWRQDVAALDTLKAHSLTDLVISPTRPLPDIPTAAMQRLIDYLDAKGFHYGLEFGPGIAQPVRGYVVRPSVYRYDNNAGITALWQTTDADAAAYFTIDSDRLNVIVRKGMATMRDNQASAPIDVPADVGRPITLLVPRETPAPRPDGAYPDIWSQFDSYRDSLMAWMSHIKFGSGLRFFQDPIGHNIAFNEETAFLVPDSPAFQLEWESFLARKYSGVDDVRAKWMMPDDFKSLQDMARLIPLWSRDRGFPYLYDPATGKTFQSGSISIRSSWWDDFIECRDGSLRYLLNALADLVKQRGADVPVVYSSLRGNQSFAVPDPDTGFDGVCVATTAQEPTRLGSVTGPALSQLEQMDRKLWFIARIQRSAAAGGADSGIGYATDRQLDIDLTDLRLMGVKGLYVNSFQCADTERALSADWLANPADLDWLHAYAATISTPVAAATASTLMPQVLYYPEAAPGPAHIGMIPGGGGTVWLPTHLPGSPIDWWPSFSGYALSRGTENVDTVLISLQGPRKVDFVVPFASKVTAQTPEGGNVEVKVVNKNQVQVMFGREPIVFHTAGQELVPIQAATDTLVQLQVLWQVAAQHKAQTAAYSNIEKDQAALFYKDHNYSGAFAAARQQIDSLVSDPDVAPYIWLEGEATPYHNFTEVAPNPEASGGAFLRLSTPNPCPRAPKVYATLYAFSVPEDGDYQIWLACTPPGPTVSPFTWYVDRDPEQPPVDPRPQGTLYLNDRFGWIRIGNARMRKGQHRLSIKVTDRAVASHLFSFSLDSVMIMPVSRPFLPDNTTRPVPVDPRTVKQQIKAGRDAVKQHGNPLPSEATGDLKG